MRRQDENKLGKQVGTSVFWWTRASSLLRDYSVARLEGAQAAAEGISRRLRDAARRLGRAIAPGLEKGGEVTLCAYFDALTAVAEALALNDGDAVEQAGDDADSATAALVVFLSAAVEHFPGETLRVRMGAHTKLFFETVGHQADGNAKALKAKEDERLAAARQIGLLLDEWRNS